MKTLLFSPSRVSLRHIIIISATIIYAEYIVKIFHRSYNRDAEGRFESRLLKYYRNVSKLEMPARIRAGVKTIYYLLIIIIYIYLYYLFKI